MSGALGDVLRRRTRTLHARAERAGVLRELLRGRASPFAYALWLRNLLPAYDALERALGEHRDTRGVRAVAWPPLYRASALEQDLRALGGRDWPAALPLLPAGRGYARRVASLARDAPQRLVAHAYVRYLGDLNGGPLVRQLLVTRLGIAPAALAFYEYPAVRDLAGCQAAFRRALEDAGRELDDAEAVADEAEQAFRLNIALAEAVQAQATAPAAEGNPAP